MRRLLALALAAGLALAVPAVTQSVGPPDAVGTLFYTIRFADGTNLPGVRKADYAYTRSGPTVVFSSAVNVWTGAAAPFSDASSDGLFFTPAGDLVVGNWSNAQWIRLDPNATDGVLDGPLAPTFNQEYHLTLHPDQADGLITSAFGSITSFGVAPHTPLGAGVTCSLPSASDQTDPVVSPVSFAFDADKNGFLIFGNGSDTEFGGGGFAAIDLGTTTGSACGTITTLQLIPPPISAAHSMSWDPFLSNLGDNPPHSDFILTANSTISHVQVLNPGTASVSASVVSSVTISGVTEFDQGSVDGHGHLFIADAETGTGYVVDYSQNTNGTINDPSNLVTASAFLDNSVDDLAPLVGQGAPPTPTPTPTSTEEGGGTPLPTDTATPTPTPTATTTPAPAAGVPHFQCYEIHRRPLGVSGVGLRDDFGPSIVSLLDPRRLCTPADKNGENPDVITVPDHLVSYTVEQTDPLFHPFHRLVVANQFGRGTIDVTDAADLLVPTAKSLADTPPPLVPSVDHFKCYRVRNARTRVAGVTVDDQFGSLLVDVKRPVRFCSAADKNGEGVIDPSAHLLCYRVRLSGASQFTRPGKVFTSNQFGSDEFKVFGPRELCVPSTVIPPVVPD